MFIVAPADNRTIVPKPAGVDIPSADRDEHALRWCGLAMSVASSSPASNGAVLLHTARMRQPGVDRREPTLGRRGLAIRSSLPQQATVPSSLTPQVW